MWRTLLIAGLGSLLLFGVAQAQIDRKAGARGATIKKPRRGDTAPQQPAPKRTGLTAAQRALAEAIAASCQEQADLSDVPPRRLAARPAPGNTAPEPEAPAQATADASAAPTESDNPALAAAPTPAPVAATKPVAPAPPPATAAMPQPQPQPAVAAPAAAPEPPPAAVPAPPAPAPPVEALDVYSTGQPAEAAAAAPAEAAPQATSSAPEAAPPASKKQPGTFRLKPRPAMITETVVDQNSQVAATPPADEPLASAITSDGAAAVADTAMASQPPAALAPAAQAQPAPPAAPPAVPALPPASAPQDAVQPAPALPDPAPVPDPALAPGTEERAAWMVSTQRSQDDPPSDKRNADELNSRRPQLKITRRTRQADAPDPATAPGPEPAADADTPAVAAEALDGAAGAAAQNVIDHAADVAGATGPVAEADAAAAPDTTQSVDAAPAAASAKSAGFDQPFTPRENSTSLDQVTSGRATPARATPPAAAMALDTPERSPQPAASLELPAPSANASILLTPLGLDAGAGTLSANYGGGAPVELMLSHDAARMPDYSVRADLQVLTRGNVKRKQVALTFDDGPHPQATSQILAVLAYYRVPATFFFTGIQAQKHPQWVRMAHQAGHEIGNHTYDHFRIPKLPRTEQEYQIDEYQRLIEGLVDVKPRFLRPPGGQLDKPTQQLVAQRGMIVAMWDVNINDVKTGKTQHDLLATSLKNIRPGSVILAHDGPQSTIDMLPELIVTLKKQGYTFVTMSELASGL